MNDPRFRGRGLTQQLSATIISSTNNQPHHQINSQRAQVSDLGNIINTNLQITKSPGNDFALSVCVSVGRRHMQKRVQYRVCTNNMFKAIVSGLVDWEDRQKSLSLPFISIDLWAQDVWGLLYTLISALCVLLIIHHSNTGAGCLCWKKKKSWWWKLEQLANEIWLLNLFMWLWRCIYFEKHQHHA